jgi:hypothetical protein
MSDPLSGCAHQSPPAPTATLPRLQQQDAFFFWLLAIARLPTVLCRNSRSKATYISTEFEAQP